MQATPCNPTAPNPAPGCARLFFACSDLINACYAPVPDLLICLFRARSSPQPPGCKSGNTMTLQDFPERSQTPAQKNSLLNRSTGSSAAAVGAFTPRGVAPTTSPIQDTREPQIIPLWRSACREGRTWQHQAIKLTAHRAEVGSGVSRRSPSQPPSQRHRCLPTRIPTPSGASFMTAACRISRPAWGRVPALRST